MVKHIIIWSFIAGYSELEKTQYSIKIKNGLEGLKSRINGIKDIRVYIDLMDSSTGDVMLDSTFTDEEALKEYQTNPYHLEVAEFVRSVMGERKCVDFVI